MKDDPTREYLEKELERESFAGVVMDFGLTRVIQTWRNGGFGISFVRWNGCLWHLLVDVRVRFDQNGSVVTRRAYSACGESFPIGGRVEGKVDTDPHQAITCSKCWEHVESVRVANILMEDTEDVWRD